MVEPTGRVALMAIHPNYAEAILDGRKTVEFRKRRLADDIRTVLIYATSPVKAIVGSFEVDEMVVADPESIWDDFGPVGVIEESAYDEYFAASPSAVAIKVTSAERFDRPIPLSELKPAPATPQSFTYISGVLLAG